MSAGSEMPPGVASELLMASTVLWLLELSVVYGDVLSQGGFCDGPAPVAGVGSSGGIKAWEGMNS